MLTFQKMISLDHIIFILLIILVIIILRSKMEGLLMISPTSVPKKVIEMSS